jgi:hypothetical protein
MKTGAVAVDERATEPLPTRKTSNEETQEPAPLQTLPPLSEQRVPAAAKVNPQRPGALHVGVAHAVVEAGQVAAVVHSASQTMVSAMDVLAAPPQTGPTLPPSTPAPSSPTASVTVQFVFTAVPQENVGFAEVGFVRTGVPLPQVAVHWMVSVPPLPEVDAIARAAVSGG